jgi:uncharacterized protein
MSRALTFSSIDGLVLEGMLDGPDDADRALVLCHPHPQMGGTMNAPLLEALTADFADEGWGVVRFNFRGIGRSEGNPSTGPDETADALGAIAEARRLWPRRPVAVAGWSFGAAVAIRAAAEDPTLAACVAIAPSVEAKEGTTAGLPSPDDLEIDVPLLVVTAANDAVVAPAACRAWAEGAFADHIVISGANHFFWARYDRLSEAVRRWLGEVV